jgi:anti-sigma factor RsiW
MSVSGISRHEESWVLLPWLASGRLPQAERAPVEEHLRGCQACAQELALQRLMCRALTEPERVTYAPAPSFRKLMERIDGCPAERQEERHAARARSFPPAALSAWRPPGLAWAASFVAVIGLAAAGATAYRWSQPLYVTHTAAPHSASGVLHIALERSLSIGEVEELLRSAHARVVEGPDAANGIFGVTPTAAQADPRAIRALALRLRADARVRWVEPVGAADAPDNRVQGRRTQDPQVP